MIPVDLLMVLLVVTLFPYPLVDLHLVNSPRLLPRDADTG